MCLIIFDWQPDSGSDATLLTLSANRDEFFRRDADPMQWCGPMRPACSLAAI